MVADLVFKKKDANSSLFLKPKEMNFNEGNSNENIKKANKETSMQLSL